MTYELTNYRNGETLATIDDRVAAVTEAERLTTEPTGVNVVLIWRGDTVWGYRTRSIEGRER